MLVSFAEELTSLMALPPPQLSAPFYVTLSITGMCNLRCKYCYVPWQMRTRKSESELTFKEICKILDDFYNQGVSGVELSGGEPSLRDDFVEIIQKFKDYEGMRLNLVTNGIPWSDSKIKTFAQIEDAHLAVSVDGASSEVHASVRGTTKKEYDVIITNIQRMVSMGMPVDINFTVTKLNQHDLPNIIDLADKLNIGALNVQPFLPAGLGYINLHELYMNHKEWSKFAVWATKNVLEYRKRQGGITCRLGYHSFVTDIFFPLKHLKDEASKAWNAEPIDVLMDAVIKRGGKHDAPLLCCEAGRVSCFVDERGFVYPCDCVQHPHNVCGSLRDTGYKLEKIWNDSPFFDKLRKTDLASINEACAMCPYNAVCGGGCRSRSFHILKNYFGPDPYCPTVESEGETKV